MVKKILIALILTFSLAAVPEFFIWAPVPVAAQGGTTPEGDVSSGAFMFDLSNITHTAIEGTTRQSWIRGGINYFFERIVGVMATVIGSLAVLMMSVGGFLMLFAGDNETRYEKGKNYAIYSLVGLGVTLLAYIMVTLVQLLIKSIYA